MVMTHFHTTPYRSPDDRRIPVVSTMGVLFSDDFGGTAIDPTRWAVYDGGLPAVTLSTGAQAAIGSGVNMGNGANDGTNSALSVAASALTVTLGTVNGAELWLLSQQIFAGQEDLTVILSRSQALAANSIFIGMVEVDMPTGLPILNPNLAGDFSNRGGVDYGKSTGAQQAFLEALSDSSGSAASVTAATFAPAAMTTTFETRMEFHAEDIIAQTCTVDGVTGLVNAARVSTQCPNDGKAYKLLLRFRNLSAPASSTTVTIQRILVVDGQELRVEVASGRGDASAQKSIAAQVVNTPTVVPVPSAGQGASTTHKLISAATTNATSVKASQGVISGGSLTNTNAATRYFKLYNKASAPTVGTDTPTFTITLIPNVPVNLGDFVGACGYRMSTGVAYAITGGQADNDATAIGAGDVVVNLLYT
jgi:hypothetical protein